jgi:hypothetical protein
VVFSAAFLAPLLALATYVVVPLDDRPVTAQLPQLLGTIAGARVAEPPRPLLGAYLEPGDPDALAQWLAHDAPADASGYVVSADMMVYGGLVASRIPGVDRGLAQSRLDRLAALRARRSDAMFSVFGTVMRLAPTGIPALGRAAAFPFAGADVWGGIQQYANLPDPPVSAADAAAANRLRDRLGPQIAAYLATRTRNRDVDLQLLALAAAGAFDRVVLGQDDAGPVGLHLRDLAALRDYAAHWDAPERASIEPGADELGMALLAADLSHAAHIVPRVRIVYSRADGAAINDPIEFAPIDTTIRDLIRTCGAQAVEAGAPADFVLYVRVPSTNDDDERAFVDAIAADPQHAAIADLTFLATNDYAQQRALTDALTARGVATRVMAFASWNTTANTVGTTLPEAIAVLAGQRSGSYDRRAHLTFTLMRYLDDVIFHTAVRPALNDTLTFEGIRDHTYLAPNVAEHTAVQNRALLWRAGIAFIHRVEPQLRADGFTITLPWDRTFETEIDLHVVDR